MNTGEVRYSEIPLRLFRGLIQRCKSLNLKNNQVNPMPLSYLSINLKSNYPVVVIFYMLEAQMFLVSEEYVPLAVNCYSKLSRQED